MKNKKGVRNGFLFLLVGLFSILFVYGYVGQSCEQNDGCGSGEFCDWEILSDDGIWGTCQIQEDLTEDCPGEWDYIEDYPSCGGYGSTAQAHACTNPLGSNCETGKYRVKVSDGAQVCCVDYCSDTNLCPSGFSCDSNNKCVKDSGEEGVYCRGDNCYEGDYLKEHCFNYPGECKGIGIEGLTSEGGCLIVEQFLTDGTICETCGSVKKLGKGFDMKICYHTADLSGKRGMILLPGGKGILVNRKQVGEVENYGVGDQKLIFDLDTNTEDHFYFETNNVEKKRYTLKDITKEDYSEPFVKEGSVVIKGLYKDNSIVKLNKDKNIFESDGEQNIAFMYNGVGVRVRSKSSDNSVVFKNSKSKYKHELNVNENQGDSFEGFVILSDGPSRFFKLTGNRILRVACKDMDKVTAKSLKCPVPGEKSVQCNLNNKAFCVLSGGDNSCNYYKDPDHKDGTCSGGDVEEGKCICEYDYGEDVGEPEGCPETKPTNADALRAWINEVYDGELNQAKTANGDDNNKAPKAGTFRELVWRVRNKLVYCYDTFKLHSSWQQGPVFTSWSHADAFVYGGKIIDFAEGSTDGCGVKGSGDSCFNKIHWLPVSEGGCDLGPYASKVSGFDSDKLCTAQTVKYKAGRVFTYHNPDSGITTSLLSDLSAKGLNPTQQSDDKVFFNVEYAPGELTGLIDVLRGDKYWQWLPIEGGIGGDKQCNDGVDNDGDGECDFNGCYINGQQYPKDTHCLSENDNNEFSTSSQCADTYDNDNDDKVDLEDPGCENYLDEDEGDEVECNDGMDNDEDGTCDWNGCIIDDIELPSDPECTSKTDNNEAHINPQCSDGLDNDEDSLIDYKSDGTGDPGCADVQDDNEADDPIITQCNDRVDNDNDGYCDYDGCIVDGVTLDPDPGCESTEDNNEADDNLQCSDNLDNDGDGTCDFGGCIIGGVVLPKDYGCIDPTHNDEQSEDKPQCNNQIDDDGDGGCDWNGCIVNGNELPRDPECSSLSHKNEWSMSTQCADGYDNDGDGDVDYLDDNGCESYADEEEQDDFECNDDLDNDNDGKCDYNGCMIGGQKVPRDSECRTLWDNNEKSVNPQCSDGLDNDGDGKKDYPDDPDCENALDNSEAYEVSSLPACSDQRDNDNDGTCDYAGCTIGNQVLPPDQGCSSLNDDNEAGEIKAQCENGVDDDGDGLCDYAGCTVTIGGQTQILQRDPQCVTQKHNNEASPLAQCRDRKDNDGDGKCDYDGCTIAGQDLEPDPGCLDLNDIDERDLFQCNDNVNNDEDTFCDTLNSFCIDGTTAGDPDCSTETDNNERFPFPQCNDDYDNDGDGLKDLQDPGCDDSSDDDERDASTACTNNLDDDGDGLKDYKADGSGDPGCWSPQDNSEEGDNQPQCNDGVDNDGDGRCDLTTSICTDGSTAGDPQCAGDLTHNNELVYREQCRDTFDNDGDGLVDLKDPGCSDLLDEDETDPKPQCSNDLDDDGDGFCDFDGCSGMQPDPDCLSSIDNNEYGISPQCDDGEDNDGDGLIDYGWDPGCEDANDEDESNPPTECDNDIDDDGDGFCDWDGCGSLAADPGCEDSADDDETDPRPECDDGLDNDLDGAVDYPADDECISYEDNNEASISEQCRDGVDNDDDGYCDWDGCSDMQADPGCKSSTDDDELNPKTQCGDGLDNDGDGKCDTVNSNCIDGSTPGDVECISPTHNNEMSEDPQCRDDLDNDADGKCDFYGCESGTSWLYQDPGCDSEDDVEEKEYFECNDGVDNDNDGGCDYAGCGSLPGDPQCSSLTDNNEKSTKPQCNDGVDNDGDGLVDYVYWWSLFFGKEEGDPGCDSFNDDTEKNPPTECDDGIDNDNDETCDWKGCITENETLPPDEGCEENALRDWEGFDDQWVCTPETIRQCFPPFIQEDYIFTYHQECSEFHNWDWWCGPDYDELDILPPEEIPSCTPGDLWPCPRQFGVCQGSYQNCTSEGQWPGCSGVYAAIDTYEPGEETTLDDFLDNDCDGVVDEGGWCEKDDVKAGSCGSLVGECSMGDQYCIVEGFGSTTHRWSNQCNYTSHGQYPVPESKKDNKDNDCDGASDEGFQCSRALWNGTRECGYNDKGECELGEQKCSYLFGSQYGYIWGACVDAVYPVLEIPNDGLDNDCDGDIDEDSYCDPIESVPKECGSDTGVCSKGTRSCVSNNKWGECKDTNGKKVVEPGDQEEACGPRGIGDDLDNDCDGTVDEGCNCDASGNNTRMCATQTGSCKGSMQQCVNSVWEKCEYGDYNDTYEKKEKKCSDDLDNDCDGKIDLSDSDCDPPEGGDDCSDGTEDGDCNDNGRLCDDGSLDYRCSTCGCPTGKYCHTDGRCLATLPPSPPPPVTPTPSDSDGDGLSDDQERILGTNPYKADTDGDGTLDGEDFYPLCNEDGNCEQAETGDNCPGDCEKEDAGFPFWLIFVILVIVILILAAAYLYMKKGKKKKPKKSAPVILTRGPVSKKTKEHSNVKQLYDYVKNSMNSGIPVDQIRSMAAKAGWSSREIDSAIGMAKKDFKRKQALTNLVTYVKTNLSRGVSAERIKNDLVKAGWNREEINWAFTRARLLSRTTRKPIVRKPASEVKPSEAPRVKQYIIIPETNKAVKPVPKTTVKKTVKKTTKPKTTEKKTLKKRTTKTKPKVTKKKVKAKTTKTVSRTTNNETPKKTIKKPAAKIETIKKVTTQTTKKTTSIHPKTKKVTTKIVENKPVIRTTKKIVKKQ